MIKWIKGLFKNDDEDYFKNLEKDSIKSKYKSILFTDKYPEPIEIKEPGLSDKQKDEIRSIIREELTKTTNRGGRI